MNIEIFECGPVDTNGYLVWDNEGQGAMIDCPLDSFAIISQVIREKKITLTKIFNTHGHFDHIGNNYEFQQAYHVPIYIHKDDEWRIIDPTKEIRMFGIPTHIEPTKADVYFNELDVVSVGSMEFTIYHTPGHSDGSVVLFNKKDNAMLVGDVLFRGAVGRWDLVDGNYDTLMKSLQKIVSIYHSHGTDITIYSGHGQITSIATEIKSNPFLRRLKS